MFAVTVLLIVDRARTCPSAVLENKASKKSNSGESGSCFISLTNVRLFVKRTVVFTRCFFNSGQQVKETRKVTTVRKKMNMGKIVLGKYENFSKYSVLAKLCKFPYFK
jgi:hypothetical protein